MKRLTAHLTRREMRNAVALQASHPKQPAQSQPPLKTKQQPQTRLQPQQCGSDLNGVGVPTKNPRATTALGFLALPLDTLLDTFCFYHTKIFLTYDFNHFIMPKTS